EHRHHAAGRLRDRGRHQPGPRLHGHRPGLGLDHRGARGVRRGPRRRQHGPPAPLHPRGAAPDPRARGRDGDRGPLRHRLPPHRHREEHGVPHLGAGRHVLHADGLPLPVLQRGDLLPRRRAPARHRGPDPGEGAGHARAPDGAQPDLLAPGLHRHRWHGDRCADRHDHRVPRARARARPLRAHHGPAHEPRLHPPRRGRPGPPARRAGRDPRLRRADEEAAARVRRPLQRQPDLPAPAGGHRPPRPLWLPRTGPLRPGAAVDGLRLGPAQDAAVQRLRGLRLRGPDLGHLRLLRSLPDPPQRDVGVAQDHRAVRRAPRRPRGRAGHGGRPQGRLAEPAGHRQRRHGQLPRPRPAHHGPVHGGPDPPLQAGHRGLPGPCWPGVRPGRVAARRARCPRRVRRRHPSVPRPLPRPVVHEPAGHQRDERGRHGVRRDRRHRLPRPRDGRSRPM
ncbi:MAG: NADH-ubiquinone oxidoreductase chain D, partial [uncultured Nocardioides sp.]